ncbi:Fimbrial type-IV assembly protein, outer membran secretin [gamma proteobacterium HdN1]|nr:Fimbrial type-IV assembly protein, outer membran secretin [gamma proteobacterium HdN1]
MTSSWMSHGKPGRPTTYRKLAASLLFLSPFISLDAYALQLTNVTSSTLSGDSVEIRLGFDGAAPQPSSYTIENPARIALDLPGVSSGLKEKYHTLGSGNVRTLTVMGTQDRVRLVVNMGTLTTYDTRVEGNQLVVTVGSAAQGQNLGSTSRAPASSAAPAPASVSSGPSIQDVDFHRGESGEGLVSIRLSDPNSPVDLREEGGRIVADFVGVSLPDHLRRKLDVLDFATPVKLVSAIREGKNTKVTIEAKGDYEYMAYQTDNSFTVSVKPVTATELERKKRERFQYTGEKLSLNFQDIEVRSVLQLIADFTELNLVASDTVGGKITLRLQNVPWDQALDLILKTKALDKRKIGNVLLVAPADEIAAREKLELESQKQIQELSPTRTEYITVNYAKADQLAKLLTKESGFLSERGSVAVDQRTNTLIIQETNNKLDEIRYMLDQLDVPVRQVLIEARIVIARANVGEEMGVRWNVVQRGKVGEDFHNVFLSGKGTGVESNVESLTNTGKFTIGTNTVPLDFSVQGGDASSLALGLFDDKGLLDIELSALESEGRADVVSTPKVLTADQQKAKVASGTEIPYQEASSSGATTTSFKEAVLSLEATPQITPDGRIIMDLKVNQDSIGDIDTASNIPIIDTNSVETSVIVDNGQTVVLGGVFRSEEIKSVAKTPFLGDLPVLGRLFRKNVSSQAKTELLVFITPKIVTDVVAKQ